MTNFSSDVEMVEVADGVFARLHEGLTNAGIILGDEGVLVIDSLRVPSFARDLISDVRRLSDKPVRYVIDTHSHWDHAWGNEEFPYSIIVGHANCRAEMLDLERTQAWRERIRDRQDPWSDEAQTVTITPPTLTFEDTMQIWFAGRRIELRYLGRAHTSGDIFIHLPEERLVFTGDVAQDGGVPYMLDGYPRDWIETDTRLVGLEADRFVSGHGPIGEAPALAEARDFIAALAGSVETSVAEGRDEAAAGAKTVEDLRERFGGWRGFDRVEESARYAFRQFRAG
jgi:cyclase